MKFKQAVHRTVAFSTPQTSAPLYKKTAIMKERRGEAIAVGVFDTLTSVALKNATRAGGIFVLCAEQH